MYHPNNNNKQRNICAAYWFGERHKIYIHTHTHTRKIKMLQFIIAIDANGKWNAYARVSFPKKKYWQLLRAYHSSVAYHLSLSIPITVIQIDTHICKMLQSISLTLGLNGDFEQCTVIFQSPSSSISITRAKIPLPWKN